jgi:hypothetical protein
VNWIPLAQNGSDSVDIIIDVYACMDIINIS